MSGKTEEPSLSLPDFKIIRIEDFEEWDIPFTIEEEPEMYAALKENHCLFAADPLFAFEMGWGSLCFMNNVKEEGVFLPLVNGIPIPKQVRVGPLAILYDTLLVPLNILEDTLLLLVQKKEGLE